MAHGRRLRSTVEVLRKTHWNLCVLKSEHGSMVPSFDQSQ